MDDRKSKESFYQELCKRFPNNHIEILSYEKASGPISYKCLDCGTIYNKSRANHLYENKTLCQKCWTGRSSDIRNNFIQASQTGEFDILEPNLTKATSLPWRIRCNSCGKEYDYKIGNFKPQIGYHCRFCSQYGEAISEEDFVKSCDGIRNKNMKDYSILKYTALSKSVKFRHKCGYVFSQLGFNFRKGYGCPKCSPIRSQGERCIIQWLDDNGIIYELQKRFPQLGELSYDFYLPDYKLLIEYQGEQHYSEGPKHWTSNYNNHDLEKRKFAQEQGYTLLEISYLQFNDIEQLLKSSTTISEESRPKPVEAESILKDDDIV